MKLGTLLIHRAIYPLRNRLFSGGQCAIRPRRDMGVFLKPWFLLAAVLGGLVTPTSAPGADAHVQLFPFTGEVRIANPHVSALNFVLYSLDSPGGALIPSPSVWKSITDVYDASGNGFIDSVNNWLKLSSSSMKLTEGVIPSPGGSLPPYHSISLGNIWDADATPLPDVTAQVASSGGAATVVVELAIAGDYNADGTVDRDDYTEWKLAYGQSDTVGSYLADGNLNGVVDAADYTVWRNNFGLSLAASGATLSLSAVGVPEPSSLALAGLVLALMLFRRRRA
jgi:hypothetical protein